MHAKELKSCEHRPVGQDRFLEAKLPRTQVSRQVIPCLQHLDRRVTVVDFVGVMQVKI